MKSSLRNFAALLATAASVLQVSAAPRPHINTAPGAAVRPYVVQSSAEPQLSHRQLVRLLRQHIKYIFVLYQENRSFDSYFGTFPGASGLFSQPSSETPGFNQPIMNLDGTVSYIHPFRIGPAQYAADTDDVDHSHPMIVEKMHVVSGTPRMDRFAESEEQKYFSEGKPTLEAKQFGELTMAYEDCNTVPFLWRFADRFTLMDHIFQLVTGPSTPGNLDIIAAQTGVTQWVEHPQQGYVTDGASGPGEPVVNDSDPFWGSPYDLRRKVPVNPYDFTGRHHSSVQYNQTYASLPLTLAGKKLHTLTKMDELPAIDLDDIGADIKAITATGHASVAWRWYEEGFDHEPKGSVDPVDASGLHASYITHHNGPQYFGYVSNNPKMRRNLRGLGDFFRDVESGKLPAAGGVFYVKGGYGNIAGMKPADPRVRQVFVGDDDHPGYSDAMISEAMVARAVDAIAMSRYWKQSAIIITWDDSEGDYDHVPPPALVTHPNVGSTKDIVPISDGPRVPLIVISPYARVHYVDHAVGSHASVVKFVDRVMGLIPLAKLPDELAARKRGKEIYHESYLGPA
ncbi:MAG: phosphoesterase, partial [Alphaproteobacteria bacterium]|nr:phosphoesterase [Alphaproteobacteria bacterium]